MVAAAGCLAPEPATAPPPTTLPSATPRPSQATDTPGPLPVFEPSETVIPLATLPAGAAPAQVLYERGDELWALSLPSQDTRLLLRELHGSAPYHLGCSWGLAPDGRHLALARNGERDVQLLLAALPAGALQEISRCLGRVEALHWSHDSSRLAFVVSRRDERTGDLLEASVRVYDVVSGRETEPYSQTYQPSDSYREEIWLEGWLPGDGALYVALAMDRTGDPGMLHSLDLRSGQLWLVSEDYLLKGGRAISAATSRVLLRRRAAGGRASPLYVAQAGSDGSLADIRLLSPADWTVGAVAWSPDGQQVVVERLEAQLHGTYDVHLWLLTLDGEAPRLLTGDATFREEQPVWAPDGGAIVFGRWLASQPQPAGLWILRLPDADLELVDEVGARPQAVAGGER